MEQVTVIDGKVFECSQCGACCRCLNFVLQMKEYDIIGFFGYFNVFNYYKKMSIINNPRLCDWFAVSLGLFLCAPSMGAL